MKNEMNHSSNSIGPGLVMLLGLILCLAIVVWAIISVLFPK
jgi:hypothetical protein